MFKILVIFMMATGQMTAQLSQDTFPDRALCKMMLTSATMQANLYISERSEEIKDFSLGCVNQKEYGRVEQFIKRMNREWKKKYGQTARWSQGSSY